MPLWLAAFLASVAGVLLGGGSLLGLAVLLRRRAVLAPVGAAAVPSPAPAGAHLLTLAAELETIRTEWVAWRKAADAFLDALADESEAVDRRRRRASQQSRRASEAEQKQEAAQAAPQQRDLIRIARAQGIPL